MEPIRVLVVDDSRFVVSLISSLLDAEPDISVVGHALDGLAAVEMAEKLRPDIITMDVVMPRMDGLEATRRIAGTFGIPILVLSAHTVAGAQATLDALDAGALDCVAKPAGQPPMNLDSVRRELLEKIRHLAGGRKTMELPVLAPAPEPAVPADAPPLLVVMGASTGGIQVVQDILRRLGPGLPYSILVVQHFPAGFTRQLAERLASVCSLPVVEAESGTRLTRGWAYVAPGGLNIEVTTQMRMRLSDGEEPDFMRPSIDVAMISAARVFGRRAVGVLLTGMGSDGAVGMKEMGQAGARLFVQTPETAVARGMPRAAIEACPTALVISPERIAATMISMGHRPTKSI